MATGFLFDNWLFRPNHPFDYEFDPQLNPGYEKIIQMLYTLFQSKDPLSQTEVEIFEKTIYNQNCTAKQKARFFYAYGRVQHQRTDFLHAMFLFEACLNFIERNDKVSQIQINYHFGSCQLQSSQYGIAYSTYTKLLKDLKSKLDLNFLEGDRETFTLFCYFMRAKSAFASGSRFFASAEQDLLYLFDRLNRYIANLYENHSIPAPQELDLADLLKSQGIPMLMRLDDLPESALSAKDQISINWYYLMGAVPWQYCGLLMWQYIFKPESMNAKVETSRLHIVRRAAYNVRQIPSEGNNFPRLMGFIAELYIEKCEKVENPKGDENAFTANIVGPLPAPWKQWLTEAESALEVAYSKLSSLLEKDIPLTDIGTDIPLLLDLSTYQREYESIRLFSVAPIADIVDLIEDTEILLRDISKHKLIPAAEATLSGKSCYLLARMYLALGEHEKGCEYFKQARIFYNFGKGNEIYLEKTRRAMEANGCK